MKRSTLIAIAVVFVVLVLIIGLVFFLNQNKNTPAGTSQTGGGGENIPVSIDNIPKPQLISQTFKGCPPSGDGGDPTLNTLKNRVDENNWQPVTVQSLLMLQWPHTIERQPHARWSPFDAKEIARYEGAPIMAEGYLVDAKKQGPETCNCHSVDYRDYHIWLVDSPEKTRDQAVVVEITPRVGAFHPAWTSSNLQAIVKNKTRVRISGWLMMDPEHPDQVGKTRGTIWEIHPIMQIETQSGGGWKALDNGTTGVASAPVQVTSNQQVQAAATAPPVTPVNTVAPPAPGSTNSQFNGAVKITTVNYDGKKTREPDEYVEITNEGTKPVDITDWVLQDPTGRDEYKWEGYTIQAHQAVRVYTNEVHQDSGGFTFGSGNAIWPNSGGTVELYDADHQLVSRYLYGKQK